VGTTSNTKRFGDQRLGFNPHTGRLSTSTDTTRGLSFGWGLRETTEPLASTMTVIGRRRIPSVTRCSWDKSTPREGVRHGGRRLVEIRANRRLIVVLTTEHAIALSRSETRPSPLDGLATECEPGEAPWRVAHLRRHEVERPSRQCVCHHREDRHDVECGHAPRCRLITVGRNFDAAATSSSTVLAPQWRGEDGTTISFNRYEVMVLDNAQNPSGCRSDGKVLDSPIEHVQQNFTTRTLAVT